MAVSIMNELIGHASRINSRYPDVCERLCFLVDEKEWIELDAEMNRIRGWHSDHAALPTIKMYVLGIEVRKR